MPFVVKVSFSYCDGSLFLFAKLLFSVSPSFFLNKQFVVVSVCVLFLSKTCPFLDAELCLLLSDIEEVHWRVTNYLNIWPSQFSERMSLGYYLDDNKQKLHLKL
jgi:hypothetical protein